MRRCAHGRALLSVATMASLAACAVGPNYSRPTITPPPAYRSVLPADQAATLADLKWVDQYWDPALTALVQAAVTENLDLRLAVLLGRDRFPVRLLNDLSRGASAPIR